MTKLRSTPFTNCTKNVLNDGGIDTFGNILCGKMAKFYQGELPYEEINKAGGIRVSQNTYWLKTEFYLFAFIWRLDFIIPDVVVNGLPQVTLPGLFALPDPYVASRMNPQVVIYKSDAVEHLNLYILVPKINKMV